MNRSKLVEINLLFIIVGMLVLSVNSCSRCSPDEEMHFRINEELLGETFADSLLAIELRIPVNWTDITEDIKILVESRFEDAQLDFEQGLKFQKGYGNLEEMAFMLIFDFDYRKISDDKEEAILTFLTDFAEVTEIFQQGTYLFNDFRFHQLTSRENDIINIKLLGYGQEEGVFLLDYYIHEPKYMNYIATIESSIGSIKHK
ncbi:MAG: hypothetical protein K0B81_00230 [Candidatus Cloacimonetes bacterium]|nr:hypothetical protein [Candidatus Cloacimonadota bacterium]